MSITTVRCPINDTVVSRIVDFEGGVARVICPSFDSATGECRAKRRALEGGRLSQLLERVAEQTLATRSVRCVMLQ